jgi:hypothetical protein
VVGCVPSPHPNLGCTRKESSVSKFCSKRVEARKRLTRSRHAHTRGVGLDHGMYPGLMMMSLKDDGSDDPPCGHDSGGYTLKSLDPSSPLGITTASKDSYPPSPDGFTVRASDMRSFAVNPVASRLLCDITAACGCKEDWNAFLHGC